MAALDAPPRLKTFRIADSWSFSILRSRRSATSDGEIVASIPTIPGDLSRELQFVIDIEASTDTHWKLAPGMKAAFGDFLLADFEEATEGWVTKIYDGEVTLESNDAAAPAKRQSTSGNSNHSSIAAEVDGGKRAGQFLRAVKESGGKLLVMTGAGMSVQSGVPVFRGSDGTMSPDFLRFLGDYNKARRQAGLREADDWFNFSVSDMFKKETEKEAWAYWRWRILRALVEPAEDYRQLQKIVNYFGQDQTFTITSNCDMLHERAGTPTDRVCEIHGCLGRVQCSAQCCDTLHTVDDTFLQRLGREPDWVPRCPNCNDACLRPNVMIFFDATLVDGPGSVMHLQHEQRDAFRDACSDGNFAVLEIGAGVVVSSIRCLAESEAQDGQGLVRINPSAAECREMELGWHCQNGTGEYTDLASSGKYFPVVQRSTEALTSITAELGL